MDDPSAIYQIVLVLHVVAAIVGFGGVITHGVYNAKAFRSSAADAKVLLDTTMQYTNVAHYGIYAVFIFGIILISLSDGEISFGDPWISASFAIWIALVGVAHGMVVPAVKALSGRADELSASNGSSPMAEDAVAAAAAKKLAMGEALTQLLLVAAIVVMTFQFGAGS